MFYHFEPDDTSSHYRIRSIVTWTEAMNHFTVHRTENLSSVCLATPCTMGVSIMKRGNGTGGDAAARRGGGTAAAGHCTGDPFASVRVTHDPSWPCPCGMHRPTASLFYGVSSRAAKHRSGQKFQPSRPRGRCKRTDRSGFFGRGPHGRK